MKLEHSFLKMAVLEPKKGSVIDRVLLEAWLYSLENRVKVNVVFNDKEYEIKANEIFIEWYKDQQN